MKWYDAIFTIGAAVSMFSWVRGTLGNLDHAAILGGMAGITALFSVAGIVAIECEIALARHAARRRGPASKPSR